LTGLRGWPVSVKYFRYSSFTAAKRSEAPSTARSPAVWSSARVSAAASARDVWLATPPCLMRRTRQRCSSIVSPRIVRTRSCASRPRSVSTFGRVILSTVARSLKKRLK
jgi:hypothetical protein